MIDLDKVADLARHPEGIDTTLIMLALIDELRGARECIEKEKAAVAQARECIEKAKAAVAQARGVRRPWSVSLRKLYSTLVEYDKEASDA